MKKQLKDLKRGETFYGAGIQWTVLDHSRSSQGLPLRTFVVSTDITENRAFDEGNKCDFAASTLRAYLNGEFLRKLEDELGAGNICEYVIDLTADDGLPKYGKDSVKVGLLTMEDYRRHRDILPPIGKWWWTATPYSGLDDYNSYVRGVNSGGSSNSDDAYYGYGGVRPALNLSSGILVSDSADSDGAYTIVWNQAPTTPPSITVPETIRSGKGAVITWAGSTDPEGGAVSYELERKINSGSFTQVYAGSALTYTDTGVGSSANTVQWRVRAKDNLGAYSSYLTGPSRTVVHNVDPTVSGSDTNLGTVTSPPSVSFTVNDADTTDELTVVKSLDDVEVDTIEDAVRNQTYTFALTAAQFAGLADGQHTMKVTVTDSAGNSATRTTTFTRSVSGIEFIVGPIETDAKAQKILVSLRYYAADSAVVLSVCNNAMDASPTWETATPGLKHLFTNASKTAAKWAVGVKVKITKTTGYDEIWCQPPSGSYV